MQLCETNSNFLGNGSQDEGLNWTKFEAEPKKTGKSSEHVGLEHSPNIKKIYFNSNALQGTKSTVEKRSYEIIFTVPHYVNQQIDEEIQR